MKKIFFSAVCMMFVFLLVGCGDDTVASARNEGQLTTVNDVLAAGMADEKESSEEPEQPDEAVTDSDKSVEEVLSAEAESGENEPETAVSAEAVAVADDSKETGKSEGGVDLDLTVLSATMVYSEVYNMMIAPEDYVGKTIKMEGLFSVFYDEVSDKYYFACIIKDATACCSQGIEFVLGDNYKYPDDYPEEGSFICVEGVFDTYMEGENMYCTLRDAELDSWTAGSIEEVR